MDKLARQVAHAKETTHYYFQTLAGINPLIARRVRRWPNCR